MATKKATAAAAVNDEKEISRPAAATDTAVAAGGASASGSFGNMIATSGQIRAQAGQLFLQDRGLTTAALPSGVSA